MKPDSGFGKCDSLQALRENSRVPICPAVARVRDCSGAVEKDAGTDSRHVIKEKDIAALPSLPLK